MLRNQAESKNGLGSQTGTQALDELRHAGTGLAAVHGKQLGGGFPRFHQRAASQTERTHRRGQHDPRQSFAEQLRDPSRLRHRLHEAQTQACRRGFAMHEPQLERLHAAATLSQKRAQLVEQRREAASRRVVSAISGSRSRPAANRSRDDETRARIRLSARPRDRACRACGARNVAQNHRAAGAGNRRSCARPSWRASARLRSGQRVVSKSGNGASRLASCRAALSTTSWPTRANHSDASGVGVSATQPLEHRASAALRAALAQVGLRRRTAAGCHALRAARPSGGSRLTRGVKNSRASVAMDSRSACSRRVSRASVMSSGASASAELRAIPAVTPAAAASALQARTTLPSRSRSTTATGILRSWPRATRAVRRA